MFLMDAFYSVDELRPRISLGYLLRRINKLSTAQVEAAFDGNDISFTQWVVLALIASGTANTCSDLSRDMDHNSGAMTRVVDQLEERGLLVRRRDEGDRRISKLIITDTGKETFAQLARSVVLPFLNGAQVRPSRGATLPADSTWLWTS